MSTSQRQKTRLGDLLVERGLITQEQLLQAIQEQKSSNLQLGEILVKHGWISKRHIRKTLKVQSKLRNAILTSILSFSPMVLVGCGSAGQTQVDSDRVVAEQQALDSEKDRQSAGVGVVDSSTASIPTPVVQSSNVGSSQNVIASGSSSNSGGGEQDVQADPSPSVEPDYQEQPDEVISADHGSTIHLAWNYPTERVDGSDLEVYEVDSFRVYQLDKDGNVGAVHVVDGLDTEYDVQNLDDGEYHFAVTLVDTDGQESDFSEVLTVSVL